MSTSGRQQLIDAWESMDWLQSLINPDAGTIQGDKDRLLHAIQDLAEALPERPKQTMKELGWDYKYVFAEADTFDGDGGKVVMLYERNLCGTEIGTNAGIFDPEDLTPTGRRYKLVLDDGHPEYLETYQDYEDAPDGTVVVPRTGGMPLMKGVSAWRSFSWDGSGEKMAGARRRVLRWGWGTE